VAAANCLLRGAHPLFYKLKIAALLYLATQPCLCLPLQSIAFNRDKDSCGYAGKKGGAALLSFAPLHSFCKKKNKKRVNKLGLLQLAKRKGAREPRL